MKKHLCQTTANGTEASIASLKDNVWQKREARVNNYQTGKCLLPFFMFVEMYVDGTLGAYG